MAVAMKTAIQHAVPVITYVVLSAFLAVMIHPKYSRTEASLSRRDSGHQGSTTTSTTRNHDSSSIISSSSSHAIVSKQFSNGSLPQAQSNTVSNNNDQHGEKLALLLVDLGITVAVGTLSTYVVSRVWKGINSAITNTGDPDDGVANGQAVKNRLSKILAKRNIATMPSLTLRELQMADEILNPDDIDSSFAQIGGLDHIKQEIYDLAVFPLVNPAFYANSRLRQPPKGILLYGKPGTGKTMLAKAIAKEAQAIFLPLQLSKILNKYWGESNKLIAATFSLAQKLQPAVIFIDELDTFLKNSNSETAYMDSIKAEFLTLWDGVSTNENSGSRVLVLGATNKPQYIDKAILRRMPRSFEVPLPDNTGRLAILELILRNELLDDTARDYLPILAQDTGGYSGSDLKELCRAAAMVPVQERTAEFSRRRVMGETLSSVDVVDVSDEEPIRPISIRDLELGRMKVSRSGEAAMQYGARENEGPTANGDRHGHSNNSNHIRTDEAALRQLWSFIQLLMNATNTNGTKPNDDRIPNV